MQTFFLANRRQPRPAGLFRARGFTALVIAATAASLGSVPAMAQISSPRERLIALVDQMLELQERVEAGDAAAIALFEAYEEAARRTLPALDPADLAQFETQRSRAHQDHADMAGADDPARPDAGDLAALDGGLAGGSPPAPPGCTQYPLVTASNATDVIIPNTADTPVTSAITISGAKPWIFQVTVVVNITHSSCHELDITLTSPSGTIVTLTTDNGNGSNFVTTFFWDVADLLGQVPYTNNQLLATDRSYAANVAAGLLVPEEGLAAFQGEDPNGVWVLTINDDVVGAGGTLTGWGLQIDATDPPGYAQTRTFTVAPALAIPDLGAVSSSLTASSLGPYICDVDVFVDIDHDSPGDLDFTIQSPSGRVVTLSTDNAGSADNVFAGTIFDSQADRNGQVPYTSNAGLTSDQFYFNNVVVLRCAPEESLGALNTGNPNGLWTLTISDDTAGFAGMLNAWGVTITTCSCAPPCLGDVNGDGQVNIQDFSDVVLGWGGCH